MSLAIALAALALAAEPAADAEATLDARFAPLRSSERRYAPLGPAGPYYPQVAVDARRSGEAVIACRKAAADGRLAGCKVVSETPRRMNFGVAAVVMARRGHILAPEGAPEGQPLRLLVPFTLGAPAEFEP